MTALPLLLATALLLGALHAFDPDHLAAMTAFIARRPTRADAIGFALRWGAGHSGTLGTVGLATTLFRLAVTPDLTAAAELAVGAMLVGLGLWVLAGIARGSLLMRAHTHDDGPHHTHLHRPDHAATGRHPEFWVGALHGLAGSAGLLVIIPVGLMSSPWGVLACVASFSLGVVIAMSACALVMSGLFGWLAGGLPSPWRPWLSGAAGCGTILLGVAWISRTLDV